MTTIAEKQVAALMKQATEKIKGLQTELDRLKAAQHEPIAIIGMGCRFPGAETPAAYWQLLANGVDAIGEVPRDRWPIADYYDPDPQQPGKISTRFGGFIDPLPGFDAPFFRISAREAVNLDPQQRLLLEVTWEALENAALTADGPPEQTGVFIGMSNLDYREVILENNADLDAYFASGNALSTASGRLSYYLGLTGPSFAVDTACSSSLTTVALAVKSLRQQECDVALAGGVNLLLSPNETISGSRAQMLAPDGHCKTFDASANGYVRAEGCGMIVLKRLVDAERDGDNILAVVRGVSVNHDGYTSGLTVPSGPAQQAVIRQALADGGVEPAQISYIEAHGTGTSLGDPIEMGALQQVFGQRTQPLFVGSAKTNIGHTEAAAGIAGLMKIVLSMQQGEIPPNLHFVQPSPHIAWDQWPVKVPTERIKWTTEHDATASRFAGVSSFGFSGTNCHVVLESAPPKQTPTASAPRVERTHHLLTLSAQTPNALQSLAQRYADYLAVNAAEANLLLPDICFTANAGRKAFQYRRAVIVESNAELCAQLAAFAQTDADGADGKHPTPQSRPKIAFLFTGQGSQYVNMGRAFYESEPTFRAAMERCDALLRPLLGESILSVFYPNRETGRQSEEQSTIHHPLTTLDDTTYTQPALFTLEYALAALWKSWGIVPDYLLGHSVGEIVAACVAGVFSLEDGLKLIAARGRLMGALPQDGEMVSLLTDEARVRTVIAPYSKEVSIAAVNGAESIVISGQRQAVLTIEEQLAAEGVKTRKLTVSHAFHSLLMEPMLTEFRQVAASITYHKPTLPIVSNLTGKVAGDEIMTPDYWVRHVCQTVRFADGVATLQEQGIHIFLEIGPGGTLLGMAGQTLDKSTGGEEDKRNDSSGHSVMLPSLRKSQEDWQQMLTSLGELYTQGVAVDWKAFDQPYQRRKIVLPTYPFQRQRFWPSTTTLAQKQRTRGHEPLGREDGQMTTSLIKQLHAGDLDGLATLLADKLSPAEQAALPTILKHLATEQRRQATLQPLSEDVSPNTPFVDIPSAATTGQLALQRISQASTEEQYEILKNLIQSEIEPIMGIVPADEQRFPDLGIDSLMAISLRNRLRSATGLELPVGVVFDHPTIRQLASYLLDRIVSQSDPQDIHSAALATSEQEPQVEVLRLALAELCLLSGVRPLHLPPWTIRPAVIADLPVLSQLEREAYGWIGEEAIAPPQLIAHRIELLNGGQVPWFWVMERSGELVAWQVLQPTSVDPYTYGSWAEATDQGRLQTTFDPSGHNVYFVAAGSGNGAPTVAGDLMMLQALLMLRETACDTIFACLSMPGYAKYYNQTGKSPEEYIALTDENGIPIDEFLALFAYGLPAKPSFRVLRDGYPPDRDSGGHGVSTVIKLNDFAAAIEEMCGRIIRHGDVLGLKRE